MRIVHIGLASFFTENMTYQDNQLANINRQDGHEVTFISNAAKYRDGTIVETEMEDEFLSNGIRLIRLPYLKIITPFISEKLRKVEGLYRILESLKPEIIMGHDVEAGLLGLDVAKYMKKHPDVILYNDTHTDNGNSGTNWVSLNIQHRILYKHILKKLLPHIKKQFYIAEECKVFFVENYKCPEQKMEFYPLGGILPSPEARNESRRLRRSELGISDDDVLLVHSGKMDALKKTDALLRAVASINDKRLKIAIIGSIDKSVQDVLFPLIENTTNVIYLGWKTGDELLEYLCACDIYAQPGSCSATLQNAICCGAAVLAAPYLTYERHMVVGNGYIVRTQEEIETALREVLSQPKKLKKMMQTSDRIARDILDYRKLAARIYY